MKATQIAIQKAYESIIDYFEANEEIFNAAIEELDAYNGYLGDDRYYSMEMLNELYASTDVLDILYRAFYGHDEQTWDYDAHGEKQYGGFNPNRDYFRYNGYGNLVSTDYKDYSDHLDEYAVKSMCDDIDYIDTITGDDELRALFDALRQAYDDAEATA